MDMITCSLSSHPLACENSGKARAAVDFFLAKGHNLDIRELCRARQLGLPFPRI